MPVYKTVLGIQLNKSDTGAPTGPRCLHQAILGIKCSDSMAGAMHRLDKSNEQRRQCWHHWHKVQNALITVLDITFAYIVIQRVCSKTDLVQLIKCCHMSTVWILSSLCLPMIQVLLLFPAQRSLTAEVFFAVSSVVCVTKTPNHLQ